MLWKQRRHFLLGFQIKFFCLKPHAVNIIDGFSGLNAHEDILHMRVLFARIVRIVGRHKWDASLLCNAHDAAAHIIILCQMMILNFQIIILTKQRVVCQSRLLCPFIVLLQNLRGHFACQAGGHGNQTFMVLFQQLPINARFVIKTLCKRQADHVDKIAIALFVFAQQNQVIGIAVQRVIFVKPRPTCDIHLTANHRLDACRFCRAVKINDAIHHTVIGNGNGVLSELLHMLHHIADAARAVQQTEFSMYM